MASDAPSSDGAPEVGLIGQSRLCASSCGLNHQRRGRAAAKQREFVHSPGSANPDFGGRVICVRVTMASCGVYRGPTRKTVRSGAMRWWVVDARLTSSPGAALMAPVARSLTAGRANEATKDRLRHHHPALGPGRRDRRRLFQWAAYRDRNCRAQGWINLFDAVLPRQSVWVSHMQAAIVLVTVSLAYTVYLIRSGLSRRVRWTRFVCAACWAANRRGSAPTTSFCPGSSSSRCWR